MQYGIRFENNEQAEKFVYQLASEVSKRLQEIDMLGKSITVKIMMRDPSAPVEAPKVDLSFFSLNMFSFSYQFLGHGKCNTYNKQIPLDSATCDQKVIGQHTWRVIQSFRFDPKDLRGIGIQIQKLEPLAGQRVSKQPQLAFPAPAPARASMGPLPVPVRASNANSRAGSMGPPPVPSHTGDKGKGKAKSIDAFEPPSFSQIDPDVFSALPDDMKKEIESEYRRRSASPLPAAAPAPAIRPFVFPPKRTPARRSPFPAAGVGRGRPNILEQLLSRGGRGGKPVSPTKRRGVTSMHMSDDDLRKVGFDPEVFALLPKKVKAEQMVHARLLRDLGHVPKVSGVRKILRPKSPSPGPIFRRPNPKARHYILPVLRQHGSQPGEVLKLTDTDDVQSAIGGWVLRHKRQPPNQKDIEFFSSYLLKCLGEGTCSAVGLMRVVQVLKWWLVMLRKHWGLYENLNAPDRYLELELEGHDAVTQAVGEAWWETFRSVKLEVDLVARKKFGGKLSLR